MQCGAQGGLGLYLGLHLGLLRVRAVQMPGWLLHVVFPISSQVQPTVCDRQRQEEPVPVLQAEEVLQSWHEERRWVQRDISNVPAAVSGPVPIAEHGGEQQQRWLET